MKVYRLVDVNENFRVMSSHEHDMKQKITNVIETKQHNPAKQHKLK